MKPKIFFVFALVLIGVTSGCTSAKFRLESDKQELMKGHRVVAEVTCTEATPRRYTTYRDRHFRILAMPPHIRWSANFRVDQVLKGEFSEPTVSLIDAKDAETSYSRFVFKVGKSYTVSFNPGANHEVKNLAILTREPAFP